MEKKILYILFILPIYLSAQVAEMDGKITGEYLQELLTETEISPVTTNTDWYVSEAPVGNDNNDGSAGNPFATLDYAIENLEDFYEANVNIYLDTGTYYISKENMYRLLEVQTLGFYAIFFNGTVETISSLGGRTQDAINPFLYHTGTTWIPGELIGCHIPGYWYMPVADNGTDWIILPTNSVGDVGSTVVKYRTTIIINDADHIVFNAYTKYGRGGIEFLRCKIRGADTNKALRTGAINPTARFKFEACNIEALNLLAINVNVSASYIKNSKHGMVLNGYNFAGERFVVEGDCGATDAGFSCTEFGDLQISNVIIKNFGIGIVNQAGKTFVTGSTSGSGIMFMDCGTAFQFNAGLEVNTGAWPYIILDTTDYLYEAPDTIGIFAVFDTSKIIYDPVISWIKNDNGHRINKNNDFRLLIKGIDKLEGTTTLSSGTATVNTPNVTADSNIILTAQDAGTAQGSVYISARTAGTSFTITSTNSSDDRLIAWQIPER